MARKKERRREKGGGRIFKRGDTYYLRLRIGKKQEVRSLGTKDLSVAKKKAQIHLRPTTATTGADIAKFIGEAKGLTPTGGLAIDTAWTIFVPLYEESLADAKKMKLCAGSWRNYSSQWRRFTAWLGVRHPAVLMLADVTPGIAKEYARHLTGDAGMSASTYNQHRSLLQSLFRLLADHAGIVANPFAATVRMKKSGKRRDRLAQGDINRLLAFFDTPACTTPNKDELRVLFNLGAWAGLRLGDCARIRRKDVHLADGVIRLVPSKTKRHGERTITAPIEPELRPILVDWMRRSKGALLLPTLAATYERCPETLDRWTREIFMACSITRHEDAASGRKVSTTGFHSFRGSAVSRWSARGISLAVIGRAIGDNLDTIEKHYLRTSDDEVKAAFSNDKDPTPAMQLDTMRKTMRAMLAGKAKLSATERALLAMAEDPPQAIRKKRPLPASRHTPPALPSGEASA
jgi:integrase